MLYKDEKKVQQMDFYCHFVEHDVELMGGSVGGHGQRRRRRPQPASGDSTYAG